ncbi:hypothetical protein [Cohaesibacter marisflavi]|uniref:hypothetical protein n=1 Tax=Cohaesibacter marisflavi TaxID=655353 RepID=UPI000B7D69E3|nr:hypothetical protein [Cohaesibacter marisflavi]
MDSYYDSKVDKAMGESAAIVAIKSLPGQEYDLKASYPGHKGKSYHGFMLDGKYTTLREAGNMLAGQNAATHGKSFTDFQKSAGRLHETNYFGWAWREFTGKTMGPPPNYGEIDYQRTRSEYGYIKGYLQLHPQQPLLP